MYKISFALSALLAVCNAAHFSKRANTLAQVGSSSCCCTIAPCMQDCQDECPPARPVPPIIKDAPPPVQEVLLDLDVIITHILHEIRPTIPETVDIPPANNPADEFSFVQLELTPLIMQVMANDIVPVLPMCTYPNG